MIEPPDMCKNHVPARWADEMPEVTRNEQGVDEWCAAYPGRFIPIGIVPMWDVDLAVHEIHKLTWENACGFSPQTCR